MSEVYVGQGIEEELIDQNKELVSRLGTALAQLAEAQKVIEFYGDDNNWWWRTGDISGVHSVVEIDDVSLTEETGGGEVSCGGKHARAYLEKYKENSEHK